MSNKTNNAKAQIRKAYGEKILELPLQIIGALSAIIIALTPSLLTASNPSMLQRASLASFCIALPCFGGYALIIYMIQAAKVDPQKRGNLFLSLQIIGALATLLGIGTDIMSTSLIAGAVFFIASAITIIICNVTIKNINNTHQEAYATTNKTRNNTA